MKRCTLCGSEFDPAHPPTLYGEAGEWLATEVWKDAGELCPRCLESRATLSMMYLNEYNT
ncbi:MAG TPA: hypothetical protein VNX25_07825 [Verrucomicrobiae bacterium]|nr:hypothetical protein [Verrucomicrobiae bacterium]